MNILGFRLRPGSHGQWIQGFAASVSSFTVGQASAWTGPSLPRIRDGSAGFTMSPTLESWMVTAVFFAGFLGPLPASLLMDRIGRKNSLLLAGITILASWLILYFWPDGVAVCLSRVLSGVWAGMVYTIVPVLNGEVFEPAHRGVAAMLFTLSMYLGGLFETSLGLYTSYDTLNFISIFPPVILYIVLFLIPESPYFYLLKGKENEAEESLIFYRGEMEKPKIEAFKTKVRDQLAGKKSILSLFTVKPYRMAFIITSLLAASRSFAGFGILLAYATVTIPPSFVEPQTGFLLLISVWTVGSLISAFLVDQIGRKPLLFASSVGTFLTMLGVALWYFLRDIHKTGDTNWIPLVVFLLNGAFFSVGLVSIPILIQGELFPVTIKSSASALTVVTIALTSGISVKLYQPLSDYIGLYSVFVLCALSAAFAAIISVTMLMETKGKTLEEIQDLLSGRPSTLNKNDPPE